MSRYAYLRDPAAIYRQSFETVNREVDFSTFSADQKPLVQRLVHACGMPEVAARLSTSPDLLGSATQALHLHVKEGDPLLKSTSLNIDEQGLPVEYGRTWFAGDRVTLTLDNDTF